MDPPQGLFLTLDIMTPEQEAEIIAWLDTHSWDTSIARRTQSYGYGYNYKGKSLIPGPPMEGPLEILSKQLHSFGILNPIQCIVNEYTRGQGIAAHIDNLNFGGVVAGYSIGADATMIFTRGDDRFDAFLPRRSLMVMRDAARYEWKHTIPKTVTYVDSEGNKINKPIDYRRISLTFRELAA